MASNFVGLATHVLFVILGVSEESSMDASLRCAVFR